MFITKKTVKILTEQYEARIEAEKSIVAVLQLQIEMLRELIKERHPVPVVFPNIKTTPETILSTLFEEPKDVEDFHKQGHRGESKEAV